MTAFMVFVVSMVGILLMRLLRDTETWWATILRYLPLGLLVAGVVNQVAYPSLPMLFGVTFCILAGAGIFWEWFVRAVTPQREDY